MSKNILKKGLLLKRYLEPVYLRTSPHIYSIINTFFNKCSCRLNKSYNLYSLKIFKMYEPLDILNVYEPLDILNVFEPLDILKAF